jgi:ABC-type transport system involved in multi-copper enzyme maturation permease subunit
MVLEQELLPYFTWLLSGGENSLGALPRFLITALVLALVVGDLVALVRYGPLKAGDLTYRVVTGGLKELAQLSPRRIWALARLAVQESLRRRAWVALVVFGMILLFASWFLKTNHQEPAKLYLSFVLTATTYLVLMISLLLSAFSLPGDFKSKTIYTIMTKPVRAGDVVLGRVLGFTLVGTALLAIMGVASYIFVHRALSHRHEIDPSSLENIVDSDGNVLGRKGRTTLNHYHRHEIEVPNEGTGMALSEHGHEHQISVEGSALEVDGPLAIMRARVPKYGRLQFLDRNGTPVEKGINVGNEWAYREFVAGGTASAAIWTFDNVNETLLEADPDGAQYFPLEIIVRVFRTHKGEIERGIQGSIVLRNPETELRSNPHVFTAKDWTIDAVYFPRKLYDSSENEVDFIDDFVSSDGRLEVVVQCLEPGQYYGFAQADCYIRRPDASPLWNFIKAYLSIWVQMVLVIAIGVTASTFLNGPVAMMATVSFIIIGFFRDFFVNVAMGSQIGGGPVESLYRLATQKNLVTRLDDNLATQLMVAVDQALELFMLSVGSLLPDFAALSTVNYVAYGFNIPWDRALQDLTVGGAFVVGLFLVGYFCLRTREVAK